MRALPPPRHPKLYQYPPQPFAPVLAPSERPAEERRLPRPLVRPRLFPRVRDGAEFQAPVFP